MEGLEKHLTMFPYFKKFTLMEESNTFATDNSNGKHLTERTMTAEEYIKESIKKSWSGRGEIIYVSDALEAIRLSKIEALEETLAKATGGFGGSVYDAGLERTIQILTNQINDLKNGK